LDPKYFEETLTFNPERWIKEARASRASDQERHHPFLTWHRSWNPGFRIADMAKASEMYVAHAVIRSLNPDSILSNP
jgi:hypothetical protein